jgi:hypothetical protein
MRKSFLLQENVNNHQKNHLNNINFFKNANNFHIRKQRKTYIFQ